MYKFLLANSVSFFLLSVKELETFLSPEFLEKASLSDDAKADIIIAGKRGIYLLFWIQNINNSHVVSLIFVNEVIYDLIVITVAILKYSHT